MKKSFVAKAEAMKHITIILFISSRLFYPFSSFLFGTFRRQEFGMSVEFSCYVEVTKRKVVILLVGVAILDFGFLMCDE